MKPNLFLIMKIKSILAAIFLMLTGVQTGWAQNMTVRMTNNETHVYKVPQVAELTFSDDEKSTSGSTSGCQAARFGQPVTSVPIRQKSLATTLLGARQLQRTTTNGRHTSGATVRMKQLHSTAQTVAMASMASRTTGLSCCLKTMLRQRTGAVAGRCRAMTS